MDERSCLGTKWCGHNTDNCSPNSTPWGSSCRLRQGNEASTGFAAHFGLARIGRPKVITGECSEDDEGPDQVLAERLIHHLGLGSKRQEAAYLAFLQVVTEDFVRAEYLTIHEFAVVLEDQIVLSGEQAREAFTEIRSRNRASEWTEFDWP
jgi:hypothetical protein